MILTGVTQSKLYENIEGDQLIMVYKWELLSSRDFEKCKEIMVTEIDMDEEQCVLIANIGA